MTGGDRYGGRGRRIGAQEDAVRAQCRQHADRRDCGEFGTLTFDEPVPHGGTGRGPSPLQAVLAALCGCEAVTFRRTATEMGLGYDSLDFEAAFTIDIRGRQGDRSVPPTSRPCGCAPW